MCGRIERSGLPDPAASGFPRVVIVLPRLAAGIAGLGYGVEAPELLAVLDVEGRHPAARARVAGAVLDDHFPVGHERRREEFLLPAELGLACNFLVPENLAVFAVDGDDTSIGKVRENLVFPQGDPARPRRVALVLDAR